jgi:folate-binding protein YgfZ
VGTTVVNAAAPDGAPAPKRDPRHGGPALGDACSNPMDTQKQIDAAQRGFLAVPRSERAVLVVTGQDRMTWLNGLLTCDIGKLGPGAVAYGLVVGRTGRVVADVVVVVDTERILLIVPATAVDTLLAHFDHYLVMEDAEMTKGESFEVWEVHGPGARLAVDAAVARGGLGGNFDRTGMGGGIVVSPSELCADVRGAIERVSVEHGAMVGDESGWEALRLELGIPEFGHDFDETVYPQEAGLEKTAVSFQKGCYLGQEVVCMLELRGHVKRRLASLAIDGPLPPQRGVEVCDASGVRVGEVTSAAARPGTGHSVALAMVKRAQAEPGVRLSVGGVPAQVVEPAIRG